jgi:hypothetical protein
MEKDGIFAAVGEDARSPRFSGYGQKCWQWLMLICNQHVISLGSVILLVADYKLYKKLPLITSKWEMVNCL